MHILSSKKELSFNRLYLSTRDGLYHFLSRYSHDVHFIEDIMQQCYLKIWERMDNIEDLEAAAPLVRTYARNLIIDAIRRRMKEDTQWLEQLRQEAEEVIDTGMNDTGKKQLAQLDTAIEKLPDAARTVYLLHREEGLSYKEIAERLSLSVSMVEKHMSKAIHLLKDEMLADMSLVLVIVAGSELLML